MARTKEIPHKQVSMSVTKSTADALVLIGIVEEDASGWNMVEASVLPASHWNEGQSTVRSCRHVFAGLILCLLTARGRRTKQEQCLSTCSSAALWVVLGTVTGINHL